MTYKAARKKLLLEQIGMAPFVWLGRLAGMLFPLKTKHKVFLFFPNADIGGSPQVNVDLSQAIKDLNPIIIFSKKAHNNLFRERFENSGAKIIDLHKFIDNKLYHFLNFFFRGVLATWINKQPGTVVFGGESIFFYKVIPHVRKNIRCIELNHVNIWVPYTIGFIDRMDVRLFSTEQIKRDVEAQYKANNLPKKYFDKLRFIENCIDIPSYQPVDNDQLEVVYIGRGSPQKRVPLIAAIAKNMHEAGDNVHFSFVGDVSNVIDVDALPFCKFYGNVKDNALMASIYQQSDVLLLTSAFEGLPLVVMQMMAHGKIVVSTAVSGIPDYIHHLETGLLITETDEDKIVNQGAQLLRILINEPELKTQLGLKARQSAVEKFSRNVFEQNYRRVLGY